MLNLMNRRFPRRARRRPPTSWAPEPLELRILLAEPLEDPIPEGIPDSALNVALTPVATELIAPNWGASAPGVNNRLYVTDQPGIVYAIDLTTGDKSIFLDVSDRLVNLSSFDERGLLGIAFDPEFATTGLFYTYTSQPTSGTADFTFPAVFAANHQSAITEWQVLDPTDPNTVADANSAREVLRINQPQGNHNAGGLNFGPDGHLYISLGDGGGSDDQAAGHSPGGNGQDPTNVFGTILRIDPQGTNSANGQYGIPPENPFVGNPDGIVEEVFAFGFRNPFRFSFDHQTGDLLVGDVGQNEIEEVSRIDLATQAGGNFGWKFKEGTFFFDDNGSGRGFVTDMDPGNVPEDLIDPTLQYDHDEGVAVVGGFVYRGSAHPALTGRYIFGDYARRLFLGDLEAGTFEEITPSGFGLRVLGFGQDAQGEVYVMTNVTGGPAPNSQGNPAGAVYRVDLVSEGVVIIDNSDAAYSTTGEWTPIPNASFPTPEGRGGDMENTGMGVGDDVATWSFTGLTPGAYRISATWSTHENRATNAPYSIFDGTAAGTLLRRTLVNQELAPGDFTDDGSAWEDLGIVTVTGDTLTVQLSDEADEYVIADAVRIEQFPTTPPSAPILIDDGDSGYADSGWNVSPLLEGRLNDIRYQRPGDGSQTATWTFTGLTPGNYTVAATWSAHFNRATNAPFTLFNGTGGDVLEIVRVNQQLAPDDFFDNGSRWEQLTIVSITGSELVVQLSNDAKGFVIADALRIEATNDDPMPPGTIIDDGDAGFTTTGPWFESLTEGRDGDVRYTGLGDGSRIATWTFSGLPPGMYRVSATWSPHANRPTDAPYTIFDGGTSQGTVDINQQPAPDDFSTLGSNWEDLMTVQITGETLIVELSNAADGFVIADAIRIQLLS